MNKILVRSIFLLTVTVLIILILFRTSSPFGKNNSSFRSEPKGEITRVEFSGNGKRLILQKNEDSWLINGKSEARKNGINFIIRVLKEIKIKSPVSPEFFDSVITRKNILPVKVKVYENRRVIKTFYVYKTRSNIYGNMMKIKDSSKPFIVYVPGYEGDIGSGFSLNELFWKPYNVFNLLPSEIASVRFENMSDTASSFKIINRNHHFLLWGDEGNLTGWDSTLVFRYISYFAWVPFESWAFETGEAEKNSIEAQLPLYRITVNANNGNKSVLNLWVKENGKSSGETFDSDRLFGKKDGTNELFIMRYFDIDPLIKKRSYFFLH